MSDSFRGGVVGDAGRELNAKALSPSIHKFGDELINSIRLGVAPGPLTEIFHGLVRRFDSLPDTLIQEYKKAPAKHADETGWRTNGKNGYARLFATPQTSIFLFGKNRSAAVPQQLFGQKKCPGVLVVDRYNGYHRSSIDASRIGGYNSILN